MISIFTKGAEGMSTGNIYFDHAATNPVKGVLEAMLPYFGEKFGNPLQFIPQEGQKLSRKPGKRWPGSSGRSRGKFSSRVRAQRRKWAIRRCLCEHEEGEAYHNFHRASCGTPYMPVLESDGFEVTYLLVDEYGLVSPEQVEAAQGRIRSYFSNVRQQ